MSNLVNISQSLVNETLNPATVTYTVIPTAQICEGDPFTVTVTVDPAINVVADIVNNSCNQSNNAQIDITITGGTPFISGTPFNITWTGPGGFTSNDEDIFNLIPGQYELLIVDSNGCDYTASYQVTEPQELELSNIDIQTHRIQVLFLLYY